MNLSSSRRGKGRRKSRRALMAEINVTPFVDVMLVLLIIFMVTAPLLAVGVPIELPDSRANAVDQTPEQITISVDGEGVIYIENEAVAQGDLPAALAAERHRAGGSGGHLQLFQPDDQDHLKRQRQRRSPGRRHLQRTGTDPGSDAYRRAGPPDQHQGAA